MIRKRIAATAAAGVLAVTGAFGLSACSTTASADTNASAPSQPGGGQQQDTTALATALATKLGVSESKVATALETAMKAAAPSGSASGAAPSGAPSGGTDGGSAPSGSAPSGAAPSGGPGGQAGGDNTEMLTAIAKSLASQLDLDESTVLSALQEVWSSQTPSGTASGQPSSQATS